MAMNPRSYALSQISSLVANVTKKNYKANCSEIAKLVVIYGPQADKHLFRTLLSSVDLSSSEGGGGGGGGGGRGGSSGGGGGGSKDGSGGQQLQLLIQEAAALTTKPDFASILCHAFENQDSKSLRPSNQLLPQVAKVLRLAKVSEVVFALGLTASSDPELQLHSSQLLRNKLPELVRSYSDWSTGLEGGLGDVAIEVLHMLLCHLLQNSEEDVGLSRESVDTFVQYLRRDFPRERVPVVLAPLLYRGQQDITEERLVPVSVALPKSVSNLSLADIIKDIGYAATASKQDMLEILKDYGKSQITTQQVAKVLGMMAMTLTGLPDSVPFLGTSGEPSHSTAGRAPSTWDVRTFVAALQVMVPNLTWHDVIMKLDYPGFQLSSPEGLALIVTAYKTASRDPFPTEAIYLSWECPRGQLSLLTQALAGCPEFVLYQHPHHVIPISEDKISTSSEEAKTWRSLSLLLALLNLAEQGFHQEVMELLAVPLQHCPELLFLGLIMAKPNTWHLVQQELISQLLPVFISNHPSYSAVLHEAWHGQSTSPHVQRLLVQAMADWYMQTDSPDPSRIGRILDVAQDLKVLSSMLSVNQFPFVIDLACWAAKREFLKLDKWVSDKIKEHQEPFVAECVQLLVSRAPKPLGPGTDRCGLTQDVVITILACLQPCIGTLRLELSEKLRMLINMHGPIPKTRPVPLGPPPLDLTSLGLPGMMTSFPQGGGGAGGFPQPGSPIKSNSGMATPPYSSSGLPTPPLSGQTLFGGGSSESLSSFLGMSVGGGGGVVSGGGGGVSLIGAGGGAIGGKHTPPQSLHLGQQQQQQQQQPPPAVLAQQLSGQSPGSGGGRQATAAAAAGLADPFGPEQTFSKEVDDKANAYFQAIYNRGMRVNRLLDMLKQFKDSPNKRDRDLFVCMLRNMFEEYKFFPQFPEKELQITGQLFGGIIEHGLVTYMSLSLALRYVLESLKKHPNSKMHLFGLAALDKFKSRLHEFPQYCASITTIPHFQNFPAYLKQFVQYGQQSMEPPSTAGMAQTEIATPLTMPVMLPPLTTISTGTSSGGGGFPPLGLPLPGGGGGGGGSNSSPLQSPTIPSQEQQQQQQQQQQLSPSTVPGGILPPGGVSGGGAGSPSTSGKPPLGSPQGRRENHPSINTTNIDTLLVAADQRPAEKSQPSEELQDKIHFLFNNLSSSNLAEKTDEFKGLVGEEHYEWVAGYLVMKRASIEPNFHSLYLSFMDTLSSLSLRRSVLRETYRNIKVILQADKTSNNFSDRAILKNLGHWLGMQTLAKNKCVLQNDIALKDLILEAYFKGQQELLYVVPFVAKVLESCAESRVFKLPCPWTVAIMAVLSELHAVQDLKLNLRFEIEVLCKHLSVEIGDVSPSNLLGDSDRASKLSQLSSPKDLSLVEQGFSSSAGPTSPQPLYHPDDITVSTLAGLTPHLQINSQIALLQQYPQLKQYVKPAVEKAVQDLLLPVAERSIKIALTTTEHIIKKDFSLDPDIHRMHTAAHHMVRHLTSGMALITCREPLLISISTALKTSFISALRSPSEELKVVIEQAANQISADNTELACAFIQKSAIEKATPEMDKKLAEEFEMRKLARSEGRRYCSATALTYQAERMPENLRLHVGGPTPQQSLVYEEFSHCLPGFLPSPSGSNKEAAFIKTEFVANEEFFQILLKCIQEISQHLRGALAPPNNPHILMMRSLLEMTMQLRITQNHHNVIALLQKSLEGLLEGMNPPPNDPELFVSFRDCHLLILKMIQGHSGLGPEPAMRYVTRILLSAREDIKYSPRAIILLIGMQIVDMKQLDEHLAKGIENGRNLMALSCSIKLVNAIVSAEKRETPITDKDLLKTKETLYRLAANVKLLPDSSAQLLEPFRLNHDIQLLSASGGGMIQGAATGMRGAGMELDRAMAAAGAPPTPGGGGAGGVASSGGAAGGAGGDLDRAPGGPSSMVHGVMGPTTELEDPPGLYEKVEYLLSEWVRHFHQPGLLREGDKIYVAYVARLQQQGILKSDDLITRFFRISIEMCVDLCYRTLGDPTINATMARAKCYHTMDAFVKLVVVLVRYSGDHSNTITKVNLLNKVLVTVAHVLLQDHESRHADFHQLAYHRFFIMLLSDLNAPDPVFDSINLHVLLAFSHVYHVIRPSRAPGFAYSWLELISHRIFIAKLLLHTPQQKGWIMFHQLLIDLFKFLAPFLRNAELTKPTQLLYKGTLRVLLVLLHDFPEFLCDYHFSFCDVIPPNCIQMRNLILSAFPRNMRLPDPFTPNLKVEMLPDITHAPRILPQYTQHISASFKKDLDHYIRSRAPVTFLADLRGHLTVSAEAGNQYSVSLMNALVLYVGTQAIAFIHSKGNTPSTSTIAHTAHMDIFQQLVVDLDTEGRYLFLNAIANQLRYPNSHTHFFSCALLSLFSETNTEAIQEQITRVLLERLIVNRPHPWGLLITFIELIKNPSYNFWKHKFVHCAPEIEKLFESVAKSCMQKQPQSIVSREEPE